MLFDDHLACLSDQARQKVRRAEWAKSVLKMPHLDPFTKANLERDIAASEADPEVHAAKMLSQVSQSNPVRELALAGSR